jgi:hypothetical protein
MRDNHCNRVMEMGGEQQICVLVDGLGISNQNIWYWIHGTTNKNRLSNLCVVEDIH